MKRCKQTSIGGQLNAGQRRPKKRVSRNGNKVAGVPMPRILENMPNEEASAEQAALIQAFVRLPTKTGDAASSRIASICPKGSILETVADIFRQTTNIPLELPVCMTLTFIAAHLVARRVTIHVEGQLIDPFLWIILLAKSGAGKTYTEKFLSRAIQVPRFPGGNTAASFVEKLSQNNRSLWLQDEFAQLIKRILTQDYMTDMREYILRTYDKSEVVRRNRKEDYGVRDPVLTILGMTVLDTFAENVPGEMMRDGFMQRFQYVYADADPERPLAGCPVYKANQPRWSGKFAKAWMKVAAAHFHPTYHISRAALDEYKRSFAKLVGHMGDVPESFYRRIMWNAFKLALVYHVILCKSTDAIDREDMRWAMNMTAIHLIDLRRLVDSYGVSDLTRLVVRAEGIRDRFQERHGRMITPREFMMRLKNVNSPSHIRFVMRLIGVRN